MNWDEYKTICEGPLACSRWALETLADIAPVAGADALAAILAGPCVPRPPGHRGDRRSDFFLVRMVPELGHAIELALAATVTDLGEGRRRRLLQHLLIEWQRVCDELAVVAGEAPVPG